MLKNHDAAVLLRIGITVLAFVVILVSTFALSDRWWDIATGQCPADTFASGKVYFSWDGLAEAALFAVLFLSFMSVVTRFPPFTAKDRERFDWIPGPIGLTVMLLLAVAAAAGLWFTSSTPVCLGASGIYHRTDPWQRFQRHAWADVTRLEVNCRDRGKSPDLYYVVFLKDRTKLDIGDALDHRAFAKLRARLADVPFTFAAKIDRSCPEWYSDWAGEKP